MADIRISNLTTASTSASDDYIGIDGSTNGTRKLSAYSPTFGGNLTVSGGTATVSGTSGYLKLTSTSASKTWDLFADSGGSFYIAQSGVLNALQIAPTTGNATFAGVVDVNNSLYIGAGSILSLSRNNPTYNTIQRDTTNGGILLTANSNPLLFKDNGNLILGTTADNGQKLQVTGSINTNGSGAGVSIDSRDGSGYLMTWYNPTGDDLQLDVAGIGTKVTFSSAGNATFAGTVTTGGTLTINPASGDVQQNFQRSGTGKGVLAAVGTAGSVVADSAVDDFVVRTVSSKTFRVTVDGGSNSKLAVNSTTIVLYSLPTSSAGLPAGSVWNDGGTLKIV